MRAGQSALREVGETRPPARSGRQGREPLDLGAGRLREADERSPLQLVLRDRARGQRQRTTNSHPARQDARWFERHQRHALRTGPAARLRHLVAARQSRLVVRVRPAVLPQVRALRARLHLRDRRGPRDRRSSRRHRPVRAARDGRRLHRGGGGMRLPAQHRLQRRRSGGRGVLPVHDARRSPVQHRPCLSSSGPTSPQSSRPDRRPREAGHLRRQARGRGRLRCQRRYTRSAGRRGDPVGGRRAVPAATRAVRSGLTRTPCVTGNRRRPPASRRRRELPRPLLPPHELASEPAHHVERTYPGTPVRGGGPALRGDPPGAARRRPGIRLRLPAYPPGARRGPTFSFSSRPRATATPTTGRSSTPSPA